MPPPGELCEHQGDGVGVELVPAMKGTTEPTSLTYEEALDEALCHGWIDGQVRRRDERTFRQRFTPRRARSQWSERNVGHVERLLGGSRRAAPRQRGRLAGSARAGGGIRGRSSP